MQKFAQMIQNKNHNWSGFRRFPAKQHATDSTDQTVLYKSNQFEYLIIIKYDTKAFFERVKSSINVYYPYAT